MSAVVEHESSFGLIRPGNVNPPAHWRVALVLGCAGGLASVLLLPYLLALIPDAARDIRLPLPLFAAAQAAQSVILVTLLAWAGLRLGFAYALDAPWLRRWLGGARAVQPQPHWAHAALLGAGVAFFVLLVGLALPAISPPSHATALPNWWQGLFASFYGGIVEETICRLLLVSLLVWIGAHLSRAPPATGLYVAAIVLAALIFGAAHLPALAQMHALTPTAAVTVVSLNAIGGCVYGWLFWRRGLEHAMLAHFCSDIVLHVLAPLVAPH
ncbi:MAG: CPBP family intramembrane glutamic endopeptidase [Rudaea sp.]